MHNNKRLEQQNFFYITTPIFFVNAKPHVGHLYCCVIADFFSRYQKQYGNICWFITGSDEHGQKIVNAANLNKQKPKTYVEKVTAIFKDCWKEFDIDYSAFIRTSSNVHVKIVDKTLLTLKRSNLFEYGDYCSFYCVHCEEYFTALQATTTNQKCKSCKRKITIYSEKNYFLKVLKFKSWLKDLLKNKFETIEPNFYVNELCNNFLNDEFRNLLVARKNIEWGISLSFDPQYEVYVWVDALCSYLSALWKIDKSGELFCKVWTKSSKYTIIHLMGKEVIRFHCIYWLIMLKALSYNYKNVNIKIHGWLLNNGDKISKSKHKTTSLIQLATKFGSDTIRFYLLYGHNIFDDFNFSDENIKSINNGILVNKIGNVFQRVFCLFQQKNTNSILCIDSSEENKTIINKNKEIKEDFHKLVNNWKFDKAIELIVTQANQINRKINEHEPWLLKAGKELKNFFEEIFLALSCLRSLMKPLLVKTVKKIDSYFNFTNMNATEKNGIVKIDISKKWISLFKKM